VALVFGPFTKLVDIHFGHKGIAVWNVGVTTQNLSPDGSGVVRIKSSSGLPPPPLTDDAIKALLAKYPVNTTVLAQQTPATVTFRFQDLAIPPVPTATADAVVQSVTPSPETSFTDATNAYLLKLATAGPKIGQTTGLTFQFVGGPDPYLDQTESFTIPLWVTIVGKKFA
jgi:hypothetical protein